MGSQPTVVINGLTAIQDLIVKKGDAFTDRPERSIVRRMNNGLGKRSCPGADIAKTELFLFLTALVQKYQILPVGNILSEYKEATLVATNSPKPFKLQYRGIAMEFTSQDPFLPMEHNLSSSSNSTFGRSGVDRYPAFIFTVILAIIGLIGNPHAIYIYIQRYKTQKKNTRVVQSQDVKNTYLVFVISLATLDLFNCLVILPLDNVYMSSNFTPLSENACKVVRWIQYASHVSGIFHIVLISVHCMRQVCYPSGRQIREKLAKVLCITFHVCAPIVSIPVAFLAGHKSDVVDGKAGKHCVVGENNVSPYFLKISLGVLSTAFVVCLIIILACYVALILTMWRKRKHKETQSNPKKVEEVNKRITTILIVLTVVFVIAYVPYMILAAVTVADKSFRRNLSIEGEAAVKLFFRFHLINNVANPIVYGLLDKVFRQKLSQMYTCMGKCQTSKLIPRPLELN
ncbi:hypothetical protein FSP39_001630 [Pinctada imbricata]|uniref:G-protein coupled receptors family 1 profile domain-containing protein n=1 Tax=Pinctada imbricata TaxID=66713 RepID=A0AA89C9L5_PINIB|nr:hypothetical protein FSP39_001630 [Pinctada imbricata]